MGCWNQTCMLSHLPVRYRDEVVAFYLYPTRNESDCYSIRYYSPVPIPFYGKYNDYGQIEDGYGDQVPLLVNLIAQYNKKINTEGTPTEIIDHLMELERNGSLVLITRDSFKRELNGEKKPHTRMEHVVILKSVFDKLLETYSYQQYVMVKDAPEGADPYRTISYKILHDSVDDYITMLKRKITELGDLATNSPAVFMFELPYGDEADHNPLANHVAGYTRTLSEFFTRDIKVQIKDWLIQGKDDELRAFLLEFCKFATLHTFIMDSRREYVVPHIGSQEVDTSAQVALAKITIDVAKEQEAEYERDS